MRTIVFNQSNIIQNGFNNTLVYNFPNSVDLTGAYLAVSNIYMYYSWDNINANYSNNVFSYNWIVGGVPTPFQVVIPDGLYEISQINHFLQYTFIANGHYLVDSEILILTEVSDKVSVHIPYEKSGHLFDLDNPGANNDYSIDMKGVIENTDLYNDYDEDDIDISFSNELESQFKSKIQHWMGTPAVKTTLDTILDKINVLGMDSLTKHELTLLQNYSNN